MSLFGFKYLAQERRVISEKVPKKTTEKGASVVEFSIAVVFFFALVGAIFDFGLAFHRYNLLQYVSSTIARKYAVRVAPVSYGELCGDVAQSAKDDAKALIEGRLGIFSNLAAGGSHLRDTTSGDYQVQAQIIQAVDGASGENRYRMAINSEMRLSCFFCILFPRGVTLSALSEIEFEDSSYSCNL